MADNNGTEKSKLPPYTPVFDILVKRYGYVTALVYGYVWRMNRLKKAVCEKSKEHIAEELGLVDKTVQRKMKVLVDDGWILDADPKLRNKPHRLYITQRLEIEKSLGRTLSPTYGVTESPTERDLKSHEDTMDTLSANALDTQSAAINSSGLQFRDQKNSKTNFSSPETEAATAESASRKTKKHAAIEAIKTVAGFYPPKVLYPRIVELLGENPNIDKLKEVFEAWVANGYSPKTFKGWLFDWYATDMYYVAASQKFENQPVATEKQEEPDTEEEANPVIDLWLALTGRQLNKKEKKFLLFTIEENSDWDVQERLPDCVDVWHKIADDHGWDRDDLDRILELYPSPSLERQMEKEKICFLDPKKELLRTDIIEHYSQ